jgi:hypothetical protein
MSFLMTFILVLGNSYNVGAYSAVGMPIPQNQVAALPAFPGAEGFGANSIGGRGGIIYEVTNLNDSGAGSLRACVEASGARTCVFRTGGLIVLHSALRIVNPYLTIAGQTAPGGGITIKQDAATDVFSTQTHDVIIRYITARPGPGGENHANQIAKNGVELYNIIIDHNSLSWGVDSNIETWYRVRDATIQWSLISEGLNDSTHSKGAHSKGLMIGGYKGSETGGIGSENISVLNNLMAHNADRNPLMQLCGIAQVMNNVTYNPMYTFSHQQLNCPLGESYINWINNYHKKGPSSVSDSDLKVIPAGDGTWWPGKVYVKGNIGPSRPSDALSETSWVEVKSGAPSGVIVTTPAPAPAVYSTSALAAYNSVIADGGVGNSRGLSCDGSWYNRRDAIDARVINEVKTGTGKIIDDPSQVGGWIIPAAGVPCPDGDHDGMPNTWEQMYGFNPNIPDGSGDIDGDGYTNVEEYLNGTNLPAAIPPVVTGITPASSSAASVNFTVAFSKPVTGVDVYDFSLTTTGSVSGAAVSGVSGTGSIYTVAVTIGSGSGAIRLNLMDNNSILDADSIPLGGAAIGDGSFTTGEIYTVCGFTKGDYNGDCRKDIAVFRPSNGTWYISGQGNYILGQSGDTPAPADYNGDRKSDIAVFRPSNSSWYIKDQGTFLYGAAGDIPVPADYNGDRKADIAVFRPGNSAWYIKGIGSFLYGTVGDIPVVADYNGDGKADIAVFRPSNSTWYIKGIGPSVYGMAGDIPVIGDYTGDGKADIAVFRPSNSTWYIKGMEPSVYGMAGDIPVIGDYNGDGKADIAVFRPSNNTWYIKGVGPSVYGMAGDIPV